MKRSTKINSKNHGSFLLYKLILKFKFKKKKQLKKNKWKFKNQQIDLLNWFN